MGPQSAPCIAKAAWLQFTTTVEARCIQTVNLGQGNGGGKSWNGGILVELEHSSGAWGTVMQSSSGNTAIISGSVQYQLVETCTWGNFYGTTYTADETPTIQVCAELCAADESCNHFIYGTQAGNGRVDDPASDLSDGSRANECIFARDDKRNGSDNCRWNLYSVLN